jgi:hypothetical protein
MRTTLALFGTALLLGAVQALSPFGGRGFDGNSLDMVFGYAGLVVFAIGTVYGANHGPVTRSVTLASWSIVILLFAFLEMSLVPFYPPGPSVGTISLALGVGVMILAIEELLRAYLDARQPRGQ